MDGRSALVWGGSRGVGRAVSAALAAAGANVAVCARKQRAAEQVAREVADGHGVRASGYGMGDPNVRATVALAEHIVSDFGGVDLLFGICRRPWLEERHELSSDAWAQQFESGFLRLKALTERLLPDMCERRWGRILWMIPSDGAATNLERQVHVLTSGLLSTWLQSTAEEASHYNVTLNVLIPGAISKDGATAQPRSFAERRARRREPDCAATSLSPRQVAAVAAFLLCDVAGCIRGETIRLAGNERRHGVASACEE